MGNKRYLVFGGIWVFGGGDVVRSRRRGKEKVGLVVFCYFLSFFVVVVSSRRMGKEKVGDVDGELVGTG